MFSYNLDLPHDIENGRTLLTWLCTTTLTRRLHLIALFAFTSNGVSSEET